jgi:hypothetical protein
VLRLLYGAEKKKYYLYKYRAAEFIVQLGMLGVVFITILWYTNQVNFWILFWFALVFIAAIGIVLILWDEYKIKKKKELVNSFEKAGGEEKLVNFIDSFGLQRKTGEKVWKHGEYSFTYE